MTDKLLREIATLKATIEVQKDYIATLKRANDIWQERSAYFESLCTENRHHTKDKSLIIPDNWKVIVNTEYGKI